MKDKNPEFTKEELSKMENIYKPLSSESFQWFGAIITSIITVFLFIVAKNHPSPKTYILAFVFLAGYLYINFTKNKKYNVWDSHLIDRSIYKKIKEAKGE